jgi:hypothetical protein
LKRVLAGKEKELESKEKELESKEKELERVIVDRERMLAGKEDELRRVLADKEEWLAYKKQWLADKQKAALLLEEKYVHTKIRGLCQLGTYDARAALEQLRLYAGCREDAGMSSVLNKILTSNNLNGPRPGAKKFQLPTPGDLPKA